MVSDAGWGRDEEWIEEDFDSGWKFQGERNFDGEGLTLFQGTFGDGEGAFTVGCGRFGAIFHGLNGFISGFAHNGRSFGGQTKS
jgi:hypothetical protein